MVDRFGVDQPHLRLPSEVSNGCFELILMLLYNTIIKLLSSANDEYDLNFWVTWRASSVTSKYRRILTTSIARFAKWQAREGNTLVEIKTIEIKGHRRLVSRTRKSWDASISVLKIVSIWIMCSRKIYIRRAVAHRSGVNAAREKQSQHCLES